MSVHWNHAECKAYQEAKEYDDDSPEWTAYSRLLQSLVWGLLIAKFPSKSGWAITEENWQTVYQRLYIVERAFGPYRTYNSKPSDYFTPAEIHSMVGLQVNAGNQSDAEFNKHIIRSMNESSNRRLRRYLDE